MHRVLLIEDDVRLAQMVADYLRSNGYAVQHAETGAAGLAHLAQHGADLVVLDLMLPDTDGLEVCRTLRARQSAGAGVPTAVLMLTARGDAMDRVVGLEMGADDYLPKPFEPRELLARIRAVLRRTGTPGTLGSGQDVMRFGSLTIDRAAREAHVLRGGLEVLCELTSYQFDLLVVLAERAGRVLTREAIMEAVRGKELEAFDRSIDVHMGRIRSAIELDAKEPKRIVTVRGVGYVFAKQQD